MLLNLFSLPHFINPNWLHLFLKKRTFLYLCHMMMALKCLNMCLTENLFGCVLKSVKWPQNKIVIITCICGDMSLYSNGEFSILKKQKYMHFFAMYRLGS